MFDQPSDSLMDRYFKARRILDSGGANDLWANRQFCHDTLVSLWEALESVERDAEALKVRLARVRDSQEALQHFLNADFS